MPVGLSPVGLYPVGTPNYSAAEAPTSPADPPVEPSPVLSIDVIPENRMRRMPAQNRMARF